MLPRRKQMKKAQSTRIEIQDFDEDNIDLLLSQWRNAHNIKQGLITALEKIEDKILKNMRKRKWDRYKYLDENISSEITKTSDEYLDKELLKEMLSESQLQRITKTRTLTKLIVMTPEIKKQVNKNVR